MTWTTADLSDDHPEAVVIGTGHLRHFGLISSFCGPIRTVQVYEDNTLVRTTLETPGNGAVLVVDGGGSIGRALVGDRLAQLAIVNGWSGLIVWGAIRDADALAELGIGIMAMATCPKRSEKRGAGIADRMVWFGGAEFAPGGWVYADADGVLSAAGPLHL